MNFDFKKARENLGLTIDELSKKSKTNPKSIKALENGNYEKLRWKTFVKIINTLNLKLELINKEDR